MTTPAPNPALEAIDDLGRRIREKRRELAAHGVVGEEIDRRIDQLMHEHDRLRGIASDNRSPSRRTLDAEIDALRASADRWVASIEREFARGEIKGDRARDR